MNKFNNFSILLPRDNPELVKKIGHHYYDDKPFTESFFCIFPSNLDKESIIELLNNLYSLKSEVKFNNYENNFVGYIDAYPIVYGQQTNEGLILYFTGSNEKQGFVYKGNQFSVDELMHLIKKGE